MTKVIGIISLKGGVGKTTIVSALGSAFSEIGKKTLLIDANLSSANLGLHFNLINPEKTLHHVLNMTAHPKEAIYNVGKFDIMPASIFEKVKVNPLKLRDRIRPLKKDYDIIIIDSSPSLDEETLGVMLSSDGILVVTTPDYPTLSSTIKAVNLAKQRGTPIMGIIINKLHKKNFEISLRDIEKTLDLPVLAVIPYDVDFIKSTSIMESYVSMKPNSKGSIECKKLASVLVGEKYNRFSIIEFLKNLAPSPQDINREIFYHSMFK
ncbi:MAG: AAA family ATPase [Candidatus Pacearchaeota archaeon]